MSPRIIKYPDIPCEGCGAPSEIYTISPKDTKKRYWCCFTCKIKKLGQ